MYVSETSVSASLGAVELDSSAAAASFLRTIAESIGVADALSYWSFTDIFEELGQGDRPFHGGFGLQTIHGIKKPVSRLLQILREVGTHHVPLALSGAPATVGGIAVTGAAHAYVDVLLYNHALATGDGSAPLPAQSAQLTVEIRGVPPGARAQLYLIDDDHTNPRCRWVQLGSPEYPTRRQLDDIRAASELASGRLELRAGHGAGGASFTLTLPADGVAAVRIA